MNRYDPSGPEYDTPAAWPFALPDGPRTVVWHTPPAVQPGCLSPQSARLLLDIYTQVGDFVLDIDDDVAFAATAADTGRHHHALAGAQQLAELAPTAGYLDLILLHWPRPTAANPHELLATCGSLLRRAGCLVIAVSVPAPQRVAHLSALTGAARTAGLRTVGHVAATATHDPEPATPVTAADLATRRRPDPHTDLLIFKRAAAPQ